MLVFKSMYLVNKTILGIYGLDHATLRLMDNTLVLSHNCSTIKWDTRQVCIRKNFRSSYTIIILIPTVIKERQSKEGCESCKKS